MLLPSLPVAQPSPHHRTKSAGVKAGEQVYDDKVLELVFQRYLNWKAEQQPLAETARWQRLFELRRLLDEPQFEAIQLAGRDSAVYECMYRSNPEKGISRSRFFSTMTHVFGFELAPIRGMMDVPVRQTMDALFNAFCDNNSSCVEWRTMLIMLRVVKEPWRDPIEHLHWGFALLGAEGSMDIGCTEPFNGRVCDVKDVLLAICSLDAQSRLLEIMDEAWFALTVSDLTAYRMTQRAAKRRLLSDGKEEAPQYEKPRSMLSNSGNVTDDLRLTKAMFDKLVSTEPLSLIFRVTQAIGVKDARPLTFEIEENHYHPLLLELVKTSRRQRRNIECARRFNAKHRCQVRWRFAAWRYLTNYVRQQKRLLGIRCRMIIVYKQRKAFDRWVSAILTHVRVVDLQRLARGGIARQNAQWARRVRLLILMLQAGIRGFLRRVEFRHRLMRREWAVTEIQRYARSMDARRIVKYRLEDYIDRQFRLLEKRRHEWENKRMFDATRRIQNAYRARRARQKLEQERQRQIAAILTMQAMKVHEVEVQRRRRIYEIMLFEWYEERRKQAQQDALYDDFSNAEKAKIMHYRRREAYREQQLKKQREMELAEMLEAQRVDEWIAKWEEIKRERVTQLKRCLENCRRNPETPEEKSIQKQIKREIKRRVKDVLRRSKEVGKLMELPEAREHAFQEYVLKRCLEEESVVDEERKEGAEAYYVAQQAKAQLDRDQSSRHLSRKRQFASSQIQRQWSMYLARKELRFRCKAVFTKEYDVAFRQAYYLNRKTGESQWRKPYALGEYDIRLKDRWVILRDDANVPYYYNPSTLVMSWEQPAGTVICDDCRNSFCDVHCTNSFLCKSCFLAHESSLEASAGDLGNETLQAHEEKSGQVEPQQAALPTSGKPLRYKLLNGALPTAQHVDLDQLEDVVFDKDVVSPEGQLILPSTPTLHEDGTSATVCAIPSARNLTEKTLSTRFASETSESAENDAKDGQEEVSETLLERAQRATAEFLTEETKRMHEVKRRRQAEVPILEYPTAPFGDGGMDHSTLP